MDKLDRILTNHFSLMFIHNFSDMSDYYKNYKTNAKLITCYPQGKKKKEILFF